MELHVSKKLLITGRMTNRSDTSKLTSIHIRNEITGWLENNSSGNKQVAFNYLLSLGIEALEKKKEQVVVEDLDETIKKLK